MIKLAIVYFFCLFSLTCQANLVKTIKTVEPSVVGIGVYNELSSPRAQLKGTGFFIKGNLIATNYHVVSEELNLQENEKRVLFVGKGNRPQIIPFEIVARDPAHDLAILKIDPVNNLNMQPLALSEQSVDAGIEIAFTGFPIGAVLGLYPVTHRGIISAITPVVTPAANSNQLNIAALKRLKNPFFTYQLDATAYPGNSGSPVYDQKTGKVIAVINKVFVKETKESVLSAPSGITYAIPIKYLTALLNTNRLQK